MNWIEWNETKTNGTIVWKGNESIFCDVHVCVCVYVICSLEKCCGWNSRRNHVKIVTHFIPGLLSNVCFQLLHAFACMRAICRSLDLESAQNPNNSTVCRCLMQKRSTVWHWNHWKFMLITKCVNSIQWNIQKSTPNHQFIVLLCVCVENCHLERQK